MPTKTARKTPPLSLDARERRLLAEFQRAPSVAALASTMAKRLGRGVRADDLLVEAGLAASVAAPRRARVKVQAGIGA